MVHWNLEDLSAFSPESELAVYYEDECVGSSVINENGYQVIQAWESTATESGFVNGEPVRILFWDGENEYELDNFSWVEFPNWNSSGTFISQGISGIEIESLLSIYDNMLPKEFALHQNYPNPFNPVTNLRFDLPYDANVSLIVYDLLGREVARLVNGFQEAGYKSFKWNAMNNYGKPVSAGVYVYRIQTGQFIQTRKMVLLK